MAVLKISAIQRHRTAEFTSLSGEELSAKTLTPRQLIVASAAAPVFLAKGYARTTMGDIAKAASLSREGLYLIFPNKEEVFTASVTVLDEALHGQLEAGIATRKGLRGKLDLVFDYWIDGVFELQRKIPEAADMDDLRFPVVRAVYARLVKLVASIIAEAAGPALTASVARRWPWRQRSRSGASSPRCTIPKRCGALLRHRHWRVEGIPWRL